MWNGKKKALAFSYDDGVVQDRRLVEIFNKYGLKCTFNLNSALFDTEGSLIRDGVKVCHDKISRSEVSSLYVGHEVAAHTLKHPLLTLLPEKEIIRQVEDDRLALSDLVGYEVVGMAYPGGDWQNSDRVERVIREHTGVKYARTISHSFSTAPSANLYRYMPTTYHRFIEQNYIMFDEFMNSSEDGVFCVWGHSYEFDIANTWDKFEEFCKYVAGRGEVYYGTCREVLLT